MDEKQWDMFFSWLMALFPQWKTSIETSVAWYGELKEFESSCLKQSIRNIMEKESSPFPPGCFDIKKDAQKILGLALPPAEYIWDCVWNGVRSDGVWPEAATIACKLIPDTYARNLMTRDAIEWLRKRFVETYDNNIEYGKTLSTEQLLLKKQESKQLPDKFKQLIASVLNKKPPID